MKKKIMLFVVLGFIVTSCASAPVLKEGLQIFGNITIEDVVFYEKLACAKAEDVNSCKFTTVRNDEFSKEVSATFRGAFVQKLRESGMLNIIKASIRIGIQMVYNENPSQVVEIRLLQARVSVFRGEALIFEKQQRVSSPIIFKAMMVGGPEVLAKRFADALGGYFANEVATLLLREKTN